jgi:hypothetical protein
MYGQMITARTTGCFFVGGIKGNGHEFRLFFFFFPDVMVIVWKDCRTRRKYQDKI